MTKQIQQFLYSGKSELCFLILYKLLVDFSYAAIIQTNYNEYHQFDTSFHLLKFLFAFLCLFIIYALNNKMLKSIPKLMVKLFIVLMYIPICTIYACKDESSIFFLLTTISFLIFILIGGSLIRTDPLDVNGKASVFMRYATNIMYYGFFAITVLLVFSCLFYNGIPKLTALNLRDVYIVRENFYLPRYLYYLYEFESGFIIYFLLIVNLKRKNYRTFALLVFIQLLFFLWKGDKSAILGLAVVLCTYLLSLKIKIGRLINKAFCLLTSGSLIIYYAFSSLPFVLFVRRMLIIPANLKFIYYDFFTTHDAIGIVGTVLNSVLKMADPYANLPYQNLISKVYFNKAEMWSNTGFLAEGYARGGIIGSLLIAVLMGFILYLLYIGVKKANYQFILCISIIPFITLNDGYLLTSFTFGAIGLLCLTCFFFDYHYLNDHLLCELRGRWKKNEKTHHEIKE